MSLRTGIDIVKVSRIKENIKKSGNAFLNRIFTSQEIKTCSKKSSELLSFAGRFAAKEAFIKAMGGTKQSFRYKDIEVKTEKSGQPSIFLKPALKKKLKLTRKKISVSLAHEKEFAVAIVVIL